MSENSKTTIKCWAEDDRPREKLLLKGSAALSDAELIAILIGSGNRQESAVELSQRILQHSFGNLIELSKLSIGDLMKFKGIETPEHAKTLAGLELVVPRDKACPLEEGEYYVNDLCQCVLMYKGTLVGTITGVMEGGAGDLLEVTLSESEEFGTSKLTTRILPLRKEFVGKIDIKAKTVELMHRWILE